MQQAADRPEVTIKYHNTTDCKGGTATEVRTTSRLCNIVPGAPNRSSYVVTCNENGDGGVARFCSDTSCNNCPGQFTFSDNQCTAIDPTFGSVAAEVSIDFLLLSIVHRNIIENNNDCFLFDYLCGFPLFRSLYHFLNIFSAV